MLVEGQICCADGESSNGRTAVSDTVNRGSNPRSPATHFHDSRRYAGYVITLRCFKALQDMRIRADHQGTLNSAALSQKSAIAIFGIRG